MNKNNQRRIDHAWMRVGMVAPNIPIIRDEKNNYHYHDESVKNLPSSFNKIDL